MSLLMNKCAKKTHHLTMLSFFFELELGTTGGRENFLHDLIATTVLIAGLLFPAFFLLSHSSWPFLFQWQKMVFETHWLCVGQRFPGPMCHGDCLWRIPTNKSFHESLSETLGLPEGTAFSFLLTQFSPAFVNLWFLGSLGLPSSRN